MLRGALTAAGVATLVLLGACAPTTEQGAPPGAASQDETTGAEQPPAEPRISVEQVLEDALTAPQEFQLTPPEAEGLPPHRVGLLLPLSGPRADLGQAMLRAAELAMFDIADDQFALVVRDTKGTPEGARRAAEEAIAAGANLLLGPVFSSSVDAVAPVAEGGRVPVVAFSNNREVARPGVWVTGLLPSEQVDRIVGYAASQGNRSFALLAPDNRYGELIRQAMREATDKHDVALVDSRLFDPDARDISEPVKELSDYSRRQRELKNRIAELERQSGSQAARELRRLKNLDALGKAPFDAVLFPIGGSKLRQLAPTLPYYDIDPDEVQFLGTAQWSGLSLAGDPTLQSGWYPAPPPESQARFEQRYRTVQGTPPPDVAALAYDATALAALMARRAVREGTPPFRVYTEETLTQRNGFAGVNGLFRLNTDGLVERGYAVMRVTSDGPEVLDPAPSSFVGPTN
ncbi:penicillin-binding protein activator [Rhodovibrio salinarum]|uniref:Penicillin-binding protein activator n=1 Tax=Rhodovibrio salinarum TaxID=1087 RepID=A0A934UZC5_9PROT|nr:penicillin-binding protein activator [Rhodovibrio salinarum]MBK1697047.1 penicillin-binding protein activator [Rhodovibrio salinarum]